ncbi:MAG: class I SAM-dependent methyltransferase [Melioribacteraceae bacterium]|nr:class I SAM-dependent methyltransferase [Melioribacteraceae bacterium]
MNNSEFYNSFAEDYNSMIPLEKQIESKKKFFKNFIDNKTKTAADLGAGSGADSIALAKLGLNVTAFEPSIEMLNQAEINLAKQNVEVVTHNKKISEIDESFHNSFDVVVSLGNTFANINRGEIELSVKKLIALMKPGGKAIIQVLNYDKILEEKERIVNITESNEKRFIRFYDFYEDKVYFNILSFQKDDFSSRQLITTEIFPYTKTFLQNLFTINGAQDIEFYGDMNLAGFIKSTSQDLIIILNK